jgi:copper(I)-binding protein
MFKLKLIVTMMLTMIFLPVMAGNVDSNDIYIENPWVRAAPPNAPILGAFMTIHNKTKQDVNLLSATAKGFEIVELHRTIKLDGIMKMVKQKYIPIARQDKRVLKPGSWHIMLINPERVPNPGEFISVVLVFDNGIIKNVSLEVRKTKPMNMKHNMKHNKKHNMGH